MSRAPRLVALIAVLALPIGAALATVLLVNEPDPPPGPEVVRVGESLPPTPSGGRSPKPSTPRTGTADPEPPQPTQLPPPPPRLPADDADDGPDGGDDADDGPDGDDDG